MPLRFAFQLQISATIGCKNKKPQTDLKLWSSFSLACARRLTLLSAFDYKISAFSFTFSENLRSGNEQSRFVSTASFFLLSLSLDTNLNKRGEKKKDRGKERKRKEIKVSALRRVL